MFREIIQAIQDYSTIIIHRHSRPDGDAMGSQIGLKNIILENFPGKTVYVVGDAPLSFLTMPGSEMDEIPDSTYDGALAILLDSASPHLISDDRYTLAARTARIDHHIYCATFTDLEVIDTSYESCCGMITSLAVDNGLKLNAIAARALYTGMVTDSGRFRYDSISPRTFRLAAALLECGIDVNELYRSLYADELSSRKLKAHFTLNIQKSEGGVLYIYTDLEEFNRLGTDVFTVSRGMVGTMSDIRGADIWANFTETEQGVLCELRSNRYNINPIAVKYGGGGHEKACGATVPDRETAMAMLRDLDALRGEA